MNIKLFSAKWPHPAHSVKGLPLHDSPLHCRVPPNLGCPQDEVLGVFDQVALSPSEVCVILLGPSCGNPYNPWNQTWTVKLPPTPRPPVVPVPPPKVYIYVHAYILQRVWE